MTKDIEERKEEEHENIDRFLFFNHALLTECICRVEYFQSVRVSPSLVFFPLVFSSFVFAPAALNHYLINIHFQSRRKFTKNIRVESILSAKVDSKIVL